MRYGLRWVLAALLTAPMIGCGGSNSTPPGGEPIPKDEHSHPTDLSGAVKELTTLRDAISDGFKENDEEKAHGPLHHVGDLLGHMVDHMDDMTQGLSDADKATVSGSTEKVYDLFMKVDQKMHGHDGPSYPEVSAEIDAEIAKLTAVVEGESTPPTEPKSDQPSEPAKEPTKE